MTRGAPAAWQFALDGQILWTGVRQASACTEEPILGIVSGQSLTLVVFREARLVVSWRFSLSSSIDGPIAFGIPPMIIAHLRKSQPPAKTLARLSVHGSDVTLNTNDAAGPVELRWRFDLNKFPAPPDLYRLLLPPATLVSLHHLEVADSIHVAVAKLMTMETERQIHRTKLAILLGLLDDRLVVDGQEVRTDLPGFYYFDPRLLMRALDFIRSDQIGVGLSELEMRRAFLSLVGQEPNCTVHCALLSVGLDTQRLIAPARDLASQRS
ncbi:MAG TPA: hypothetical protein VLC52_07680 [Anaerolineae bacterium]|nr:hypothetical protein [Anaerolineae bacterium]